MATGAVVTTPVIPGIERASVITGALLRQIMAGELQPNESWRLPGWQQVLVRTVYAFCAAGDDAGSCCAVPAAAGCQWARRWSIIGSDLVAIELAEFLAERGRTVHVVDAAKKLIPEVGKKRRHEHMDRLDHLRITVEYGGEYPADRRCRRDHSGARS